MIVYQATKREFLNHCHRDDIEKVVLTHFINATGYRAGAPEINAWKNSLLEMSKVLGDEEIPEDCSVGIEYQLPQSSKRIDFVIAGLDKDHQSRVVIVELKQWSESRRSDKDAIIWARRGGRSSEREGTHPSYQAWSYATFLEDFNSAVQQGGISLRPCAYLHNHPRNGEIDHPHYKRHIEKAPLFLEQDRARLQEFIRSHVRYGDSRNTLYIIDQGRISPSKSLSDNLVSLLKGNSSFVLIDEQKVAHEGILEAINRSTDQKQVVVVQGGPGTGKSIIAINLLGALTAKGKNVRYVSKNAAPRAVYEAQLSGSFKKSRISNMFSGSGSFVDAEKDCFDVLLVDEAHRLNEKSGLYRNKGENQIKELIHAARCTVFFVDNNQQVTLLDIGHTDQIQDHSNQAKAQITELQLASQFRCGGSDGYLAWLDQVLQVSDSKADFSIDGNYDFRIIDSPTELHSLVQLKNRTNNKARVVAGYCWTWPSKKNSEAWDILIPEFDYKRRWNLDKDGSLWIVAPESVEEVGCIHTCQGLELDYVGVIIGPDMTLRNGKIVTDATKRASSDQSVKGLKALMKTDPQYASILADRIVKNTYRTLLTRGMKGCFVYCTDSELAEYLRSKLNATGDIVREGPATGKTYLTLTSLSLLDPAINTPPENVVPFKRVTQRDRTLGVRALPVIDLKFAAGEFSSIQSFEADAVDWVEPPSWVTIQPDLFMAQVTGESMNRRIPNGSWCLFRANPSGSRQGKVVVVEKQGFVDPETAGRYTIKVYSSKKLFDADGQWQHEAITLSPDSDDPGFTPIEIRVNDSRDDLKVVAELLAVF